MADDNIESQEQGTPELSPVEQKAMEQGWVPQEQWEGDPADWRPAKEFVDRGELFKKIDDLKRSNKALQQGHEELVRHHMQVRQLAYKEALETLRAQKAAALEEGDAKAVVVIDEKIDETKEAIREASRAVAAPNQPDPIFDQWVSKNTWYQSERAMKAFADEVAREAVGNGMRDKEELLQTVEKAVRKEFAHKFENPRRNAPGAVEGGATARPAQKKDSVESEMSEGERRMMDKILRVTPTLTKEQYLKEYKAIKSRGV